MELEFWWLLLFPLFFGLGWIAARVDIHYVLKQSKALPARYFKGLNLLLADQPDQALDLFLEVAKAQPQAVELNLSLGQMFRRRGDSVQAIRLHQTLLERPDLSEESKETIQYELAQDFMKAGLLDRAEAFLLNLQTSPKYGLEARRYLLKIFQQERDWARAIEMANQLHSERVSLQHEMGQFYCELAEAARIQGETETAKERLESALIAHRKCVRAHLLFGEWAFEEGNPHLALQYWQKIETQNPLYLSLVADKMLKAFQQTEQFNEGRLLLKGYLDRYPELDIFPAVFELQKQEEGDAAAEAFLTEYVERKPSLMALSFYLGACSQTPTSAHPPLSLAYQIVHQHVLQRAMHICTHCGFQSRQFFWHCPACHQWETFSPIRQMAVTR